MPAAQAARLGTAAAPAHLPRAAQGEGVLAVAARAGLPLERRPLGAVQGAQRLEGASLSGDIDAWRLTSAAAQLDPPRDKRPTHSYDKS